MRGNAGSKSRKRSEKKPVARRGAQRPNTWGRRVLKTLKWLVILGVALAAAGAAVLATMFWIYGSDPDLPSVEEIGDYDPYEVTRVRASDGKVVGEIFHERRRYADLEEIPDRVVQAFIAAEDESFFEHEGIDYVSMVRAALVNLRYGETRQGASTITQQVVKTFLLTPDRTFKRKIQEVILARRLEEALSKEKILSLYLNQIYFGHGRYGLHSAAEFYFAKEPSDLTVGEAALLAGLPQSPNRLSPKREDNAERAKGRQTYVLRQMAEAGFISDEEALRWIERPIEVAADPFPAIGEAPEWVEIARRELASEHGEEALARLGAEVHTTLDRDIQALARSSLQAGLRAADERHDYGRPIRSIPEDRIDLRLARLERQLPDDGPRPAERYRAIVREVQDDPEELLVDLGDYEASIVLGTPVDARYNPGGLPPSERFSPGDLIHVVAAAGEVHEERGPTLAEREVRLAPGPEGAAVVMDPQTREVLAIVGGYSQRIGDFNRATRAMRQPGSAFKPFVYAAALDTEEFTPATIVNDAPEVYDLWQPQNYEAGEFAGPVRLREALARSINTVAIRLAYDVGPEEVAELARWTGIESELPAHLSLALGSGEVTPLELTNAFATIAAGGEVAPPRFVDRVSDDEVPTAEPRDALRPEVAYLTGHMMRSVVTGGTAARANVLDAPVMGKTGTSNDARDNWFVGMTPSFVVGVWVGFDDNLRIGRGATGGRTALPVFIDIMEELSERERETNFERPAGIVEERVDEETGLLAHDEAPAESTYVEVFLEGTEPTEQAPAPGEVDAASFVLEQYDDGPAWGLGEDDGDEGEGDEEGGIFGGEGDEGDGAGGGIFDDGDRGGGGEGIFGGEEDRGGGDEDRGDGGEGRGDGDDDRIAP